MKSFEKLWKIKWLVEYRSYTPTVRGSSPLPPTRKKSIEAPRSL